MILKVILEPVVEISCYALSFKFLKNAMIYQVKSFCEVEEKEVLLNILMKYKFPIWCTLKVLRRCVTHRRPQRNPCCALLIVALLIILTLASFQFQFLTIHGKLVNLSKVCEKPCQFLIFFMISSGPATSYIHRFLSDFRLDDSTVFQLGYNVYKLYLRAFTGKDWYYSLINIWI